MGTKLPEFQEHTPIAPPLPLKPGNEVRPTVRKRRNFTWLWLLILCGLGYAGYRYYQQNQKQQKATQDAQAARLANRPVSVVTAPATMGTIPIYLRGLGSVTPYNTVSVKSRVDGQLIAIHFTEGQNVQQGDLLAEIDPRPFQVQLEQAEGQLARDQAQLTDAQANLSRYQALWNEKVIAKQQLDTQASSVGQVLGVIESDKATINNAKLQLTYAKITAPISGRIGLRLVDVGNMVHAADPNGLVVISQLQPIAVLFNIPSDNLQPVLQKLRGGVKLGVDAYDRDDRTKLASGTLLTVDNQIDATTGTSRLKAVFSNTDAALFPNQFVNARLLLDKKQNAVIVPAPALQRGPQGTYVFVVDSGKAKIRPVTVGTTEGDNVSIDKGLAGGETVVIEGQDKLQDGSKVDARGAGEKPNRKKRAQ